MSDSYRISSGFYIYFYIYILLNNLVVKENNIPNIIFIPNIIILNPRLMSRNTAHEDEHLAWLETS